MYYLEIDVLSNVCSTGRCTRDPVSQVKYATQTIIHDSEGVFNQIICLIYYVSDFFDIMMMEIPRNAGCLQTSARCFSHHDCPLYPSTLLHFSTMLLFASLLLIPHHSLLISHPHPLPVSWSVKRVIGQQRCSLA